MAVTLQLLSDECCDFRCEMCIQGSIPSTLTALLELSVRYSPFQWCSTFYELFSTHWISLMRWLERKSSCSVNDRSEIYCLTPYNIYLKSLGKFWLKGFKARLEIFPKCRLASDQLTEDNLLIISWQKIISWQRWWRTGDGAAVHGVANSNTQLTN